MISRWLLWALMSCSVLCRCLRSSFKWTPLRGRSDVVVFVSPDCCLFDHTHHHTTTFPLRRTSALITQFACSVWSVPWAHTSKQHIMQCTPLILISAVNTCMLSAAAWSSRVQVQVKVQAITCLSLLQFKICSYQLSVFDTRSWGIAGRIRLFNWFFTHSLLHPALQCQGCDLFFEWSQKQKIYFTIFPIRVN